MATPNPVKAWKVPHPILSPFPMNGHKQKPNNCTTIFYYLRSQYTLFARFPFSIHPTLLQYCSKLPSSIAPKLQIRSDRTARHYCLLISIKRISTISPVLALVLDTFAWTTIKLFPSSRQQQQSIRFYLSSPTIYYSSIKFYNWFLWHNFSSPMSSILLLIINNSDL